MNCYHHEDCTIRPCEAEMNEARAAIAELNERCSSHLISMLNLAGRQAREIAFWKRQHRLVQQELLKVTAERAFNFAKP